MEYSPKERLILDQVVTALHGNYGDRLSRVVLFGSRARRDHSEHSDYDLLAVLNDEPDRPRERKVISSLIWPICLEHEVLVQCITVSRARFEEDQGPLFLNARQEGVTV